MTNARVLVSVIIPSFKMGQFIGEALESVGAQTYQHWEVIVVDDAGPEDGTREIVEAFNTRCGGSRFRFIRHDANTGVSGARLSGLKAAKGEFIAFLDADDLCLPNRLDAQVTAFATHPDVVLCHGSVDVFGDSGKAAKETASCFAKEATGKPYDLRGRPYALLSNHICTSTVMVRREAVTEDCFPREMVFQFEDWYMWLVLGRRGRFLGLEPPLICYRMHPDAFSAGLAAQPRRHAMAHFEMLVALLGMRDDIAWSLRVACATVRNLLFLSCSRTGAARSGKAQSRVAQTAYLMAGCVCNLLRRGFSLARRPD